MLLTQRVIDHKLIKNGGDEVFKNHFSASKNIVTSLNRKYLKCFCT